MTAADREPMNRPTVLLLGISAACGSVTATETVATTGGADRSLRCVVAMRGSLGKNYVS